MRMLVRIIIALVLGSLGAEAQSIIAVHDSSLMRGKHNIPVYASLTTAAGDSVCLDLRYDPRLIDVTSLQSPVVGLSQLIYNIENQSPSQSVLHSTFRSNGMSLNSSVLMMIGLEFLAGPDSIATIQPLRLCHNGQSVSSASLLTGTIRLLDDIPVKPVATEYLSSALGQPGSSQVFRYRVLQNCSPRFSMFDTAGRMILDETLPEQVAGVHSFSFSDQAYPNLCDAIYFLRLLTPLGVYVVPFEVLH